MNFYTKVGGFLFIYNIVLLFLSDLRVFRVCGVLTCRFFASLLCLLFRWLCRCLGAFRPALIAFLLVLFGIFVLFSKCFIVAFAAFLRCPLRARSERAACVPGAGSVRACARASFPRQPSRRGFAPFPARARASFPFLLFRLSLPFLPRLFLVFPAVPRFFLLPASSPSGLACQKFLSYCIGHQHVVYFLEKSLQKSR